MKQSSKARAATSQQPARHVDSPYLTAKEAIEYLRLGSRQALYRLIAEHALPHGRRGRLHLFDKRDLDAWIRGTTALELMRKRQAS